MPINSKQAESPFQLGGTKYPAPAIVHLYKELTAVTCRGYSWRRHTARSPIHSEQTKHLREQPISCPREKGL